MNLSYFIVICWFLSFAKTTNSDFISDGNRTVELTKSDTGTQFCSLHGSGKVTRNLFRSETNQVTKVSEKELNIVIRACHITSTASDVFLPLRIQKRSLIYPGTKWCGPGDEASEYNDLGEQKETDKCCRTHDHCAVIIKHFQKKYGLYNNNPWSVNSCKCDDEFYNCLKKTKEEAASTIGSIFFNVVGINCIYPSGNRTEQCVDSSFFGACEKKAIVEEYKFREAKKF